MKLKTLMTVAAAWMLTSGMAKAVHIWEDPTGWSRGIWVYDSTTTPKFTANELQLDMFGSFVALENGIDNLFDTNIRHGKWGGGAGLNYFITRYIGIGGDFNAADNGGAFVDQVAGSLFLRVPIESIGLAPYVYGGGGRNIDPNWEWFGHFGVGLEFRFNPVVGIFADGRYMFADSTDRLLLRTGLRFVF